MKKFLVLLVLVSLSVTTLADVNPIYSAVKTNVTSKNLTTFETIKMEVESVINETPNLTASRKATLIGFYTAFLTSRYGNDEEFKKAFEFLKTTRNYNIFYFVLKAKKIYGWSKEETYNFTMQYFRIIGIATTNSPENFQKGLSIILQYGPVVNVSTQKEDLKLLNRLASQGLLKNKTKWEPIVVKIRTALETY